MNFRWAVLVAALLALGLAAGVAAQGKGDRGLRTVKGVVVDKDENPAPQSRVYLKNLKTQVVRTYITEDSGQYRFSGLDPNVDYELHAEDQSASSAKKTVSSLDGRKEITINLKLDKKKE
jgi:hypothetical protein